MLRYPSHSRSRIFFLCLPLLLCAVYAMGDLVPITGLNHAAFQPSFLFPASGSAALVSFDWDASGALHYSVGDPMWGFKLEVYKHAAGIDTLVFSSAEVWAGSRITCLGNFMYFNDGGNFVRSDFDYYRYDAATASVPVAVLAAPYGASLWEVARRGDGEFFASGSEMTWGPGALFHSPVSEDGSLLAVPPLLFGEIGDAPGPLAFDGQGNLYYAPGFVFVGTPAIYRWSAAEVAAALADPETHALQGAGHVWATLPEPFSGATGMATDSDANVYVTATSWSAPSRLIAYPAAGGGASALPVGEYVGRLETLRYRDHAIHVSCAEGVFRMPLLTVTPAVEEQARALPGETVVLAVQAEGGAGEKFYQWYRLTSDKANLPVGSGLSTFSFTASLGDNGSVYFCEVQDGLTTAVSPYFTVTVTPPVPLLSPLGLVLLCLLFLLAAVGKKVICGPESKRL